jgi:LmbE family N-acetylglucosaminyl deacetylase
MLLTSVNSRSHLLIFAPHPDDESLACGILLQHAAAAGATISVIYLTDGENNPWPQRCLSRRWRLNATDRQRWAKMRRQEALAALNVLGAPLENARFLGWPDQGLTRLLQSQPTLIARLRYLIAELSPTHIIAPDISDRHRDHSAIGTALNALFSSGGAAFRGIARWSYIVHGLNKKFLRNAEAVPQTAPQVDAKRAAIKCHQSQLLLSRRRFLGYAARPEFLRHVR